MTPLRILALFLTLGGVLVRLTAGHDPFPIWSVDPLVSWAPTIGFTPVPMMAFDLMLVLGWLLVVIADRREGTSAVRWTGPLACVAIGVIGWHVFRGSPGDVDTARLGFAWIGSLCAALTGLHLGRDPAIRRILLATLVSCIALLAARSLHQVLVEHPETEAMYLEHRDEFLQARGWTPGSASALNYERRLTQHDATAWFGLANVLATFGAVATGMGATLLFLGWRARAWRDLVPGLVLGALGGLTLGLAGSKGGVGALGLGLALAAVGMRWRRLPVGILAIVLPLLVVAARLALGPGLGELSMLFRGYYITGATRIFLDHPVLGVGPSGFKEAYLVAKPALSPEEVASPHSVLFDAIACLGLGGLAVGILLVGGSSRVPEPEPVDALTEGPSRAALRLVALVIALATIGGLVPETTIVTTGLAATRLVGMGAWIGVAFLLLHATPRSLGVAAIAALLIALAHAQIEVTPVWVSSAPWFALLVGTCLARSRGGGARAIDALGAIASAIAGLTVIVTGMLFVLAWSTHLRRAEAVLMPGIEMRLTLDDPMWREVLMRERGMSEGALRAEAEGMLRDASPMAYESLLKASDVMPAHLGTLKAASRVGLAIGRVDEVRTRLEALAEARPSAGAWGALGTLRLSLGDEDGALAAFEEAAALDPYGLHFPHRIVEVLLERRAREGLTGTERGRLSRWSEECLERHEGLRLDPLRQLSPEALERVRSGLE